MPHEIIDVFIKGGIDINQKSDKEHGQYSALHFAVDYPADFELTKALVENGMDLNLRDEYGNTAFWNACHNYRGNVEEKTIIEYLFDKKANTEVENDAGISVKDLIQQRGESIDDGLNPKAWDLRELKINVN